MQRPHNDCNPSQKVNCPCHNHLFNTVHETAFVAFIQQQSMNIVFFVFFVQKASTLTLDSEGISSTPRSKLGYFDSLLHGSGLIQKKNASCSRVCRGAAAVSNTVAVSEAYRISPEMRRVTMRLSFYKFSRSSFAEALC